MKSILLKLYLVIRPVLFIAYCVLYALVQLMLLPILVLGALIWGIVSALIDTHQETKEVNNS